MPDIFDITEWNPQEWFNTGGTRDKKYYQSPEGLFYYFKTSLKKSDKDYKYEFWSEIIASEIGNELKFNILKYDIAYNEDKIGCISQDMINSTNAELIEGGKYLQSFDINFNPDDIKLRNNYTFQLIQKALKKFALANHIEGLIEMIIFDSLIGNGDRHQENWAFICTLSPLTKILSETEQSIDKPFDDILLGIKWIMNKIWHFDDGIKKRKDFKKVNVFSSLNAKLAPIYDSGSSLGRELSNEKVNEIVKDNTRIVSYIRRGLSEIHWDKNKINHFELVKRLKINYPDIVIGTIQKIMDNFNETTIKKIIDGVDYNVPQM